MSVAYKREIKLAEAPSRPELVEPRRSGPGLRFRENRITIPEGIRCVLKWRDYYNNEIVARIINLSRFGCRVVLPGEASGQRLFVKVKKAQVEIDSATAYTGAITFVSDRQEPDGTVTAGISFEHTGCDLDALSAAADSQSISIGDDLRRTLATTEAVGNPFKVLVADLNTFLQEALQRLDIEERRIAEAANSPNHKSRLEERVINVAMSIYRPFLQNILSQFQSLTQHMSLDEEIIHKQYFRLNFQSLIKGTPFVERGQSKPLGYSGDYGMMVMLYEYSDQGNTLFNRFFHRFVCSEPAAVANRNRVGFLSDILIHAYDRALKSGAETFKVASLACGPAKEIQEFLSYAALDPKLPVKLILIDSEEHALDYAQSRIKELALSPSLVETVFLKEDVVVGTLQRKDFLSWLQDSDFIVSAGLFDYLTDRVSQRMISQLFNYLRNKGELLIGNISKKSPDVFAMDYFMDWRLILRDEPDLLGLVTPELASNHGAKADVIAESLGLNLFLRVKREKG